MLYVIEPIPTLPLKSIRIRSVLDVPNVIARASTQVKSVVDALSFQIVPLALAVSFNLMVAAEASVTCNLLLGELVPIPTLPARYVVPAATYSAYGLVIVALPPVVGALAMYSVAALVYVVTLDVDSVGCAKP